MLVEITTEGAVRTVTMNRPEKLNAMSDEMLDELRAAFTTAPANRERVTILRGAGRSFCAGRDIGGPMNVSVEPVFHAVETYPLPVIAVVQGHAIAGGCEIALHCDFVIASTNARFGMSLAQIGLAPTWFLAKKLLDVAGPVGTREILLLGDPLPATQLHELGMIARVAEPDELEAAVDALVDRLVQNAPLSLRAIKALLVREMTFREGIYHADVDNLVRQVRDSQDAVEGKRARLERRRANFQGR